MNNKLEVIGIDHGWSMMKTISQVFATGVKEITTTPALFGDVLEYKALIKEIMKVTSFVQKRQSVRCLLTREMYLVMWKCWMSLDWMC